MFSTVKKFALAASVSLLATSALAESNFYVEAHGGFSTPPLKKIKDKDSGIEVGIKRSAIYGGAIGYKVTDTISVELLVDHRPEYKADLTYKSQYGDYSDKTKFNTSSGMLNFVYHLQEFNGITPFVSIGAGLAQVQVKEKKINSLSTKMSSFSDHAVPMLQAAAALDARGLSDRFNITDGVANYNGDTIARINKVKTTAPSWQVGLGINTPVTDSLSLGVSASFQVIHNVKASLSYVSDAAIQRNLNEMTTGTSTTYSFNESDYQKKSVKKTIGVVELMASLRYDLPF